MHDIHQSARHNAPLASRRKFAQDIKLNSSAVVTEARKYFPPHDWKAYGGETQVWWSTDYGTAVVKGTYKIPTPQWDRGSLVMHNLPIPYVVIRNHKNDKRVLRAGGHHPAHLFRKKQEAANAAIIKALPTMLEDLRVEFNADVVTYSADFNLNLKKWSDANYIMDKFPRPYKLVIPPSNTFRLRVIDGAITTGSLGNVKMLPRYPKLDHRGFKFEVGV